MHQCSKRCGNSTIQNWCCADNRATCFLADLFESLEILYSQYPKFELQRQIDMASADALGPQGAGEEVGQSEPAGKEHKAMTRQPEHQVRGCKDNITELVRAQVVLLSRSLISRSSNIHPSLQPGTFTVSVSVGQVDGPVNRSLGSVIKISLHYCAIIWMTFKFWKLSYTVS